MIFIIFRFLLPANITWPFPLIGLTLVGPLVGAPFGLKAHNYTRIDVTPLYVGQMMTQEVDYRYDFMKEGKGEKGKKM